MTPGEERDLVRARAALLEREAVAGRLQVPGGLRDLEPDLQRLSARIRACGVADPFREDRLRSLPPRVVRAAVEEARKAGLAGDGPAWTQRQDQVPALAEGMHRSFQRQLDLDRELPSGRGI